MKKNFFIIGLLVIIDQVFKTIVTCTISNLNRSITIIPNVISLTYIENEGAAFGLGINRVWLIAINLLLIFVILKLLINDVYKQESNIELGFSIIVAGGIGNLIDRLFRGYVIDYFDITNLFNIPIFNFSDICIVAGAIMICVIIIVKTIKEQENIDERI